MPTAKWTCPNCPEHGEEDSGHIPEECPECGYSGGLGGTVA